LQSRLLVDALTEGNIDQEEFEKRHEELDDKYRYVK
jgi:hypothetical protein